MADHFNRHGDYISTKTQAEHRVMEWIAKNKIHPDAVVSVLNEKRGYTKKSSPYKTTDGIADRIFDNEEREAIQTLGYDARDIVEEMISGHRTLEDMKDYLTEIMEGEIKEEEGPIFDVDNVDTTESTDSKLSNLYLIRNNKWSGDVSTLSPLEKVVYLKMQEVKEGPREDTNLEKRATAIHKELTKEIISNVNDSTSFQYVGDMLKLIKTQELSITDILSLGSLINNPVNNLRPAQRTMLNNELIKILQDSKYEGSTIETLNDGIVMIMPSEDNMISLQRYSDGSTSSVKPLAFIESAKNVLTPGTDFDASMFDKKVTKENATQLSEAFSEIFSNFTEAVSEFSKLDQKDLRSSILEELNQC